MSRAERPALSGWVVDFGPNLHCSVRLDTGTVVKARIPRATARRMFRVVAGDRVRVEARGPDLFIVLGLERG